MNRKKILKFSREGTWGTTAGQKEEGEKGGGPGTETRCREKGVSYALATPENEEKACSQPQRM